MNGLKVLVIGTYPPARCGIATFSRDLVTAMQSSNDVPLTVGIAAIDPDGLHGEHTGVVVASVDPDRPEDFDQLADFVSASDFDAVSLQHEYGIFGGEWGENILRFLTQCDKPVITTCHTVLTDPPEQAVHVLQHVARYSAAVVVMTSAAIDILDEFYDIRGENITVIQHGVPEFKFAHKPTIKRELGLVGKKVISSFGLVSRGKGLEHMVGAMHIVLQQHPDAVYLVIGQTHPKVQATEGESYRQELQQLASTLPNPAAVRFANRFVSLAELGQFLQATDVYVTPYLGYNQITSGTLAYALAAGKAVVSTPYLHATEALADGRGIIVPFGDEEDLGHAVNQILSDRSLAETLETRAYEAGRRAVWPEVGKQYGMLLDAAADGSLHSTLAALTHDAPSRRISATKPSLRPEPLRSAAQS